IEQTQRTRSKLQDLWDAASLNILMRREQIVHRLGADTPFQCAIDVGVEAFRRKTRAFIESQMQAEQTPGSVLKVVDLLKKRSGQLRATDECLKGLMHIKRRSNELPCPDCSAVSQLDTAGPPVFDDDAINADLRLERAAGGNECFHQSAGEI